MLVPDSVIDQARDAHPSFTKQLHPDKVLLRFLSRWQRNLVGKLLKVNRESVRATTDIPFPVAPSVYDDGFALPEVDYLHGGDVEIAGDTEREIELTIVTFGRRFDRVHWPAGYIHAGRFFPLGIAQDWKDVTNVRIVYAPTPASLTSISAASVLPDAAEDAAVKATAAYMGTRLPKPSGMPEVDLRALVVMAEESEEDFLELEADKDRAVVGRVKETWL